MSTARLEPVSPTPGPAFSLDGLRNCVIGSDDAADVRVDEPGVRPQHCVLEYGNGRWIIVESDPHVQVNGHPLAGPTRLFDRDIIAISATHAWEYVSGEQRTAEMPLPAEQRTPRKRRRTDAFAAPARPLPWQAMGVVGMACVFVFAAVVAVRYASRTDASTKGLLTDQQAIRFDSLLSVAYDHLERGNSLLELGIADEAAQEFARGINTLALSDIRNNRQVKPRIEALEGSVAAIYRGRRLAVPEAYAGAKPTMSADKARTAALSTDQFSHSFDLVSGAFRLRFHESIVVVGRDHPEHLALYGPGGALDLRSFTMSPEQIAFVIEQCHSFGIRVKDFSQDSILQRQIKAAIRAGLADRAGTGLHLHIDRFADRRDRWTIGALAHPLPPAAGRVAVVQTSKNLSRVTPESVNSAPSSSNRGSPRSRSLSSTYVPLRLESIR
jgi:hypothetical protein